MSLKQLSEEKGRGLQGAGATPDPGGGAPFSVGPATKMRGAGKTLVSGPICPCVPGTEACSKPSHALRK